MNWPLTQQMLQILPFDNFLPQYPTNQIKYLDLGLIGFPIDEIY